MGNFFDKEDVAPFFDAEDIDQGEASPVAVQEPPQEMVHTYLADSGETIATPANMDEKERENLIFDSVIAQQYENQSVNASENPEISKQYENFTDEKITPSDNPSIDIAPQNQEKTPLSSLEEIKNEFLAAVGAPDQTPKETATTPTTDVAGAVTYGARRVAGSFEKANWAMFEGALRAERAIYKYAPDRLTDMWIKGMAKEAKIARLTRQIDYWSKPEKYGWVSPQVDLDKKLNEETAYRRNYYYGLVNSLPEAATDFFSFVAHIGMAPGGMKAVGYAGKALPYIASNAAHAVTSLAPYALATTSGGVFPRLHSALILSAFGMVKPLVNLTGFRKISATMIATAMNSALTSPEIINMYKEKGGANKEFFKLFVPWIATQFAFGVYMKDTPVAEKNQARTKFVKMMVKDFGIPHDAAKTTVREIEKSVQRAEKAPEPEAPVASEDPVEGFVPSEVKFKDFRIPQKVLTPEDKVFGRQPKQVYPEWKDPDTQEGLKSLRVEVDSLEKSSYTLVKEVSSEGVEQVVDRMKVAGESPEHLRHLSPKRTHKGKSPRKADLEKIDDALNGLPQTKAEHDRIVDLLQAQQDFENAQWAKGQDYFEGKSQERPEDYPVNQELVDKYDAEERAAIQEEALAGKEIWEMTPEEYAQSQKKKSVGAAGDEPTGEIPLPEIPNEVQVTTLSGEKKTIRPKEDEAFSIVEIKGADGKTHYQLHDGVVYDISVAEAKQLMDYAGVKKKNAEMKKKPTLEEYVDGKITDHLNSKLENGGEVGFSDFKWKGEMYRVAMLGDTPVAIHSIKEFESQAKETNLHTEEISENWTDNVSFAIKEKRFSLDYDKTLSEFIKRPLGHSVEQDPKMRSFRFSDELGDMKQLTSEYEAKYGGNKSVGAKGLKPGEGRENDPHYQAVKKALEAGKPVPEHVLAAYPDLKPKEPTPPKKPPPGSTASTPGAYPGQPSGRRESQFAKDIVKELKGKETADVAQYFASNMKEQDELAKGLFESNPGFAEKVATGEADMPQGERLYGYSVYVEALNRLKRGEFENAGEMTLKLADSKYAEQTSQAGSTLSALSHLRENDELDPVQEVKRIRKHREKVQKRVVRKDLELSTLEKKLKDAEEKLAKLEKESASEAPKERIITEKASFGTKNKIFTKARAEKAAEELRKSMGRLHSGIDPADLARTVEIGGFYVEGGYHEVKAWTEKMVADFGENIRPYLSEAWDKIQKNIRETDFEDTKKKIQEIVTEDGEISDIHGLLKKINQYVQASGVKGEKNILDEIVKIVGEVAPKMTREEIRDAISGYGKYKQLDPDALKAQIRDINGQWQKIAQLEALEKKQAPLKTGVERRIPSDEERALIKQVNELNKKYNIQTTNPETQLKSSLDAIKTRLKNQITDLDTQITSGEKIVKERSPSPTDPEVEALKKTRDILKKEFDRIFYEPMSDAKRVELATKSAERTVAELERRIKENDLGSQGKTSSPWSPEISQLKQKASGLRDVIDTMKEALNPSLTPEQRALNALKRRLDRSKETMQEKIQNLDFSKKQRKPSPRDAETDKARAERDAVADAYKAASKAKDVSVAEANELVRLSTEAYGKKDAVTDNSPVRSSERMAFGRAKSDFLDYADTLRHRGEVLKFSDFKIAPIRAAMKGIFEIPGLMKASAASLDNSALGNQGLKVIANHPQIWGRNAIKSFIDIYGTLSGKDMMRDIRADIFSRPNKMNGVYKEHGLYFGSEESFPTSILAQTPVLGRLFKASETAYTGFIHRARADIFDFLYEQMSTAGIDTKGLGEHVNSLTGRGNLGAGEKAANLINVGLFSGRYLKSNIDILTGNASAWANMSPEVRNKAISNSLRFYGTAFTVLLLSKLIGAAFGDEDTVEADPRSPAFGKVKLGNTSFDVTGGASSIVTLVSKFWGSKNRTTGIISPTSSDEERVALSMYQVMIRFGEGKFSPFFSLMKDMLNNMRNFKGEKLTAADVAGKVTPITASGAVEGFQASEGDLPTRAAKASGIAILSGLGLGSHSEVPDLDAIVNGADAVKKEITRLNRVGDYNGAEDLRMRNEKLSDAANTLRPYKKAIDDTQKKIRAIKERVDTTAQEKKDELEPLKEELEINKKIAEEALDEIKSML